MAIAIKTIPTLNAEPAKDFDVKANQSFSKKATINFSNQVKSAKAILNKAKLA